MAFYNYTSLSPDGKRHKGIKEATSEADLKVKLKNNNEYLISCQIAKEKRRSNHPFQCSGILNLCCLCWRSAG